MDLIPSQINSKISSLNNNGKFVYLQSIIKHCLANMPDLQTLPVGTLKDQIGPLFSLLKYLVYTHQQMLEPMMSKQLDSLQRIQRENQGRVSDIQAMRDKLGAEGLNKEELEALLRVLSEIEPLMEQLHVSKENVSKLKNRVQYMLLLSEDMKGLDEELDQCRACLDSLEKKVSERLKENQNLIDVLRGKINEI